MPTLPKETNITSLITTCPSLTILIQVYIGSMPPSVFIENQEHILDITLHLSQHDGPNFRLARPVIPVTVIIMLGIPVTSVKSYNYSYTLTCSYLSRIPCRLNSF